MLGAYAGMFVAIVNGLRNGFSIRYHKSTSIMLVFFVMYLLIGFLTYKYIYDLLPIIAGVLGTFAMFKLSGIKMRLLGIVSSGAWLTYGIIFHSIGSIITNTSVITLNIFTILRLKGDNNKK